MRALTFCIVFVLAGPAFAADFSGPIRVIDGDTLDVGKTRVRLHGIDAPERDQSCQTEQGAEWACGDWVSAQVRARFEGYTARCQVRDIDRYGRSVATCVADGVDVGREIVSQGWAFAYRRYSMAYDLDEKAAAVSDRGLHASRVQSPSQFRRTRAAGRIPQDRSCAIKGNISASGKIYHMPGQADYERTGIRPEKGERWFCSEAEARAAGWRRAKR
jgi:endonuclease YncB( thermonuclease family)